MAGINLAQRDQAEAAQLREWYEGLTLVEQLGSVQYSYVSNALDSSFADLLQPPSRDLTAPLRFPISNVYKSQSSGTAVTGRICSGILQVGEKLRVLPGDETAIIKCT